MYRPVPVTSVFHDDGGVVCPVDLWRRVSQSAQAKKQKEDNKENERTTRQLTSVGRVVPLEYLDSRQNRTTYGVYACKCPKLAFERRHGSDVASAAHVFSIAISSFPRGSWRRQLTPSEMMWLNQAVGLGEARRRASTAQPAARWGTSNARQLRGSSKKGEEERRRHAAAREFVDDSAREEALGPMSNQLIRVAGKSPQRRISQWGALKKRGKQR